MAIQTLAKQVKTGQSITDFKTQITNAVNVLKGAKTNLSNLKASLAADGDFSAEDEAEVQAVIDFIASEIATI